MLFPRLSILTAAIAVAVHQANACGESGVPATIGHAPFSYYTLPPSADGKPYFTEYEIHGDLTSSAGPPLIALHGGPGGGRNYMRMGWAEYTNKTGRAVVIYDQIGCGGSSHLPDTMGNETIWRPEIFLAELDNLIRYLGIQEYDCGGHSGGALWTAMWAARAYEGDFHETRAGLRKAIIQAAPISLKDWGESILQLYTALGPDVLDAILEGDTESPQYQEATEKFSDTHICRAIPLPLPMAESFQVVADDPTVYTTMNGPGEIYTTGSLRDVDVTPQCPNIDVDVLLISGEFDEAQPWILDKWRQCITKSTVWSVIIRNASHMSHVEQPEEFTKILAQFLCGDY